MENSVCNGIYSSSDTIPTEGGEIGYSFELSGCKTNKTIKWVEEGSEIETEWFDVDVSVYGKIKVTASDNSYGEDKSINLAPYFVNSDGTETPCEGKCIKITQKGGGLSKCDCNSITHIGFDKKIPQTGVSIDEKYEVGNYTFNGECDDSLLTFVSTPSLVLSAEKGKIYAKGYIAANDKEEPKLFEVKVYYNQSQEPCTKLSLLQEGEEPCDCLHAVEYTLHTLRKTFKDEGTSEKELIASAHTYCGTISATTYGCVMINEGDLTTENDPTLGNFYFYVKIKPRTDTSIVRTCTVNFHFKEVGEYSVYSQCAAYMVITQDGTYCRCENISDFKLNMYGVNSFRWASEVSYPSTHSSDGCYFQTIGRATYNDGGKNSRNCMTYRISNVTPEGAAEISQYGEIHLMNNVSNESRTVKGDISLISDFSTDNVTWSEGDVCDIKSFEITQGGLPTCTCNDLDITLWKYGWSSYDEIEGYTYELGDSSFNQYEIYFSSGCFDYYIDSKDNQEYGRWTIDTTNTADWVTLSTIYTACNFGSDNIGYTTAYINKKAEEDRTTTFDLVYNDRNGTVCRKTITIKKKGTSPTPTDCGCHKYSVTSEHFNAPAVTEHTLVYLRESYTACPRSDYEYEFEGGKPSWITDVTKGSNGIIGNLSQNNSGSQRSAKVIYKYTVNGSSCENYGYVTQDTSESCDSCNAITNPRFSEEKTWSTYEFDSTGATNVTIGRLFVGYNPNVLDTSCVIITADTQNTAYGNIVSFDESGYGRELIVNIKPNTSHQPQTFTVDINIFVGDTNCFNHSIVLHVKGD